MSAFATLPIAPATTDQIIRGLVPLFSTCLGNRAEAERFARYLQSRPSFPALGRVVVAPMTREIDWFFQIYITGSQKAHALELFSVWEAALHFV